MPEGCDVDVTLVGARLSLLRVALVDTHSAVGIVDHLEQVWILLSLA